MGWKKGLALCLAVVLLFSLVACQKKPVRDTSPELNFETDSQYWIYDNSSFCVAETEKGFYYLSESGLGFLHYVDKATMQDIALCNKPDCIEHETEYSERSEITDTTVEELAKCNAFVSLPAGSASRAIMYYEGNLYCVTEESDFIGEAVNRTLTLSRISLDGTERKPIWEITTPKDKKVSSLHDILLHRGQLFFVTTGGAISTLYCYDLNTETVVELREFREIPRLMARGDSLLANVYGEGVLCYTISSGEWETISAEYTRMFPYEKGFFFLTSESEEGNFWGTYTDVYGQNPQRIDFPENTTVYAVSEKYLCLYDTRTRHVLIETGEEITEEKYLELTQGNTVSADHLVENRAADEFLICDKDTMEVLGKLKMECPMGPMWFTEDRIYYFSYYRTETDENGKTLPAEFFYADLSDLGSEDFGWKQVEIIK